MKLKINLKYIIYFIFCFICSCSHQPNAPIIEDNIPLPATKVIIVSGNNQTGGAGISLSDSIVVSALNKDQLPVSGTDLVFVVISGGGTISKQIVKTNSAGRASVAWITGPEPDQILKVYLKNNINPAPVYIYANSKVLMDTKWISGMDFIANGTRYTHDNRILESNHVLVFSDSSSDDAKIIMAKTVEEALLDIKQAFNVGTYEELRLYSADKYSKIKIFSSKAMLNEQISFNLGIILLGWDSRYYQTWPDTRMWFRKVIKHESTHVFQFLFGLKLNMYGGPWTDVWFTEGFAEYMSGGASGDPLTTFSQWNNWRIGDAHFNPISVHRWSDFQISADRTGEYYPAFGLAVRYLLDSRGLGKTLNDIKAMYKDMLLTNSFAVSFERHMGISVQYFEEHFYELMSQFLRTNN